MKPSRTFVLLAVICSCAHMNGVHAQAPDGARIVREAKEALGGEKALGALQSFVATGRTRQLRGNNLVPIEFEMTCEWPDRYVRRDESPAQDTGLTVTGFSGDTLIRGAVVPPGGGPGRGAAPPPEAQVAALKGELARLLLGATAGSLPSFPLTFSYIAVAEAPEGKADVIEASGPAGFTARLFVQQTTHLPVLVTWRGQGNAENRMYFADYRDVSGIKWPFRIRRAVGPTTVEETTFDRVRINQRIDARKFEAPR